MSVSSAKETLPLTVDNIGFMLDRLGRDCAPLQYVRELTQNSIEAITRTRRQAGEIRWDVDWNRFDLVGDGVFKLSIADNGDGMTGPEMVRYINQLSSSISPQSHHGNFGVGAKIAAATRNHAGLIYLSWKNGEGAMIHLWRDPETGQYGLRQFEHPDGTFAHWLPIEASVKPEPIQEHGTMVVLLGNTEDEVTMSPPVGAASPSRWIAKYLNTRYYEFPSAISIRAREGWENPRSDADRNLLRKLTGQRSYLESHSESSGEVKLLAGTAKWWILKDEQAISQNSGFINSSGHVGALYRNELYEVETARSGVARLQQFGVIFGYNRVVVYVQPKPIQEDELTTNTARTHLLIRGEPLPWIDWAAEFREKLPKEIREFVEKTAAASTGHDHRDSIRERLKQISDLFRLSRYRPTPVGEFFIDDDAPKRGGKPLIEELASRRKRKGNAGKEGGRAGDVYATFATTAGTAASKTKADPYPRVIWVRASEGTRDAGFLEDRAATYLPDQNLIQINGDFRVFTDMVDRYCRFYSDFPGARPAIEDAVREWFEQTLVEAVLGVQSLEGARQWTDEDTAKALSEEALTTAVMPRYHLDFAIKRALGTKLGSLKQKTA